MNHTDAEVMLSLRIDRLGEVVARRRTEVTFDATAGFAAAIGAEEARYLDDTVSGGPVAPPSFVASLEWPAVRCAEVFEAIGVGKETFLLHLLHAFQDTRFVRLICPGDVLTTTVRLEAARETRSGVLLTFGFETRGVGGEEVAQSWFGAFFRNAMLACVSPREQAAPAAFDAVAAYQPLGTIAVTRAAPFLYAAAGFVNPLHTERRFAQRAGLADVAMQGTFLWAVAGERLMAAFAAGEPARLARVTARFSNVVRTGQVVTLLAAPQPDGVAFRVQDAAGLPLLTHGLAVVAK